MKLCGSTLADCYCRTHSAHGGVALYIYNGNNGIYSQRNNLRPLRLVRVHSYGDFLYNGPRSTTWRGKQHNNKINNEARAMAI